MTSVGSYSTKRSRCLTCFRCATSGGSCSKLRSSERISRFLDRFSSQGLFGQLTWLLGESRLTHVSSERWRKRWCKDQFISGNKYNDGDR